MKGLIFSVFLLSASFICIGTPAFAQQNTDTCLSNALQTVRNDLFSSNKGHIDDLKGFLERMAAKGLPEEKQREFLLNAWYAYAVLERSPKRIRKYAEKYFPGAGVFYEDADLEIIKSNAHLIDLLTEGLLKWQYPFPLNEESNLSEELQQYGLHDGMRVAEIGAGSGLVSFLIASVYNHLELYVNDLEKDLIRYTHQRLLTFPGIRAANKLTLLKGRYTGTGLDGKNLDLIFMRDAFHHFLKKKKMIASIYASLAGEGGVLVIESVTDVGANHTYSCPQTMKKDEIITLFEQGGFVLTDIYALESDYIFRFKKRSMIIGQ